MASFDDTLTAYKNRVVPLSRPDVLALMATIDDHYGKHVDHVKPRALGCLRDPHRPRSPAPEWSTQEMKVLPKRCGVTLNHEITSLEQLIQFIEDHPIQGDLFADTVYWIRPSTEEDGSEEGGDFMTEMQSLHAIHPELVKIQAMVGLSDLKRALLDQILYFVQHLHTASACVHDEAGANDDYKHTMLFGPPGTGKTEIAQLIGAMYAKIGVLQNKVFRKVTRSDLVAGYLGQTAIKTQAVIDECLGGCLFIDEVYALGPKKDGNDMYSKECIDTLCEAMSSQRHQLMVIVAGYEDEVKEQFLDANKGLASRFVWRFTLDAYSVDELKAILLKKATEGGWGLEDGVPSVAWLDKRREQFTHNGRDMETLFMYAKIAHGRRTFGRTCVVRKRRTLNQADIDAGYVTFKQHRGASTVASLPFGLYT